MILLARFFLFFERVTNYSAALQLASFVSLSDLFAKHLYQKTKLSSDSTKDFGDKIDEKMKSYSHTAEAFSPILAQKPKLNQKEKNNPRDLFFGIS